MSSKLNPPIKNRLSEIRRQRGIAASELAKTIGVSRQSIYAVEAGSYIPNTEIGLRLAQALGVSVEDLFSLGDNFPASVSQPKKATLLPLSEELQPGQAVQLCEVNGKLMAAAGTSIDQYLPASDATVSGKGPVRKSVRVEMHNAEADYKNRILLAGCDPAMGMVARYLQSSGIELVLLHQNSFQSLSLLREGYAHVAGSHLRDETAADSNVSTVNKLFPSKSAAMVSFALWQEGLVTATGNPKDIKSVRDLVREDVTFVNREVGSGSRTLLDRYLKESKLNSKKIRGYLRSEAGHIAAVRQVKAGGADCCIATEAAARFFGLNFIPLEIVRYDLIVRKQQLSTPGVQILFDAISQLSFRRKLQGFAGYETSVTGVRIQ